MSQAWIYHRHHLPSQASSLFSLQLVPASGLDDGEFNPGSEACRFVSVL